MRKPTVIDTPAPTSADIPLSPYVKTMEYLAKRYILNNLKLAENDVLENGHPVKEHVEQVTNFITTYNLVRGFHLTFTKSGITRLYTSLRKQHDSYIFALMHLTAEFRLIYTKEIQSINKEIALAFDFVGDTSNPLNVISLAKDELATEFSNYDVRLALLEANPWLTTMVLLNMIDPLVVG